VDRVRASSFANASSVALAKEEASDYAKASDYSKPSDFALASSDTSANRPAQPESNAFHSCQLPLLATRFLATRWVKKPGSPGTEQALLLLLSHHLLLFSEVGPPDDVRRLRRQKNS
jgi:hypothetical protein